jgi:4-amino-4-deoxy-L-arabinose transferase-like glycosyltransferase
MTGTDDQPIEQGHPRRRLLRNLFAAAVALLLTFAYLGDLGAVPFHPDESTIIFMSSDIETLFHDPLSMAWQPDNGSDLRQHYRELDAPLTRYLIGGARMIFGLPPLPADWNWSKTWDENQANQAMPGSRLLLVSRFAVAGLFPFSLALVFLSVSRLKGYLAGLMMVVLFAGNALVLLHTRRAMAESALIFGINLSIWGLLESEKKIWLAAIGIAIAFNSKQSAIALFPAGLLAAVWIPINCTRPFRKITSRVGIFLAIFLSIYIVLNPLAWRNPLAAAWATLQARQNFVTGQVATFQSLAPGQVLNSPGYRAAAMLANLFIQPPAIEDSDNYIKNLEPGRSDYLANPFNTLLRGLDWGGLSLLVFMVGLVFAIIDLRRLNKGSRRVLIILLCATLFQTVTLLITVPIPWQRYWMPLIPFICLWIVYALHTLGLLTWLSLKKIKQKLLLGR